MRLNPGTTLPAITVSFQWPVSSSYVLEKKVTAVLEGSFSTLKGLESIKSTSKKNSGTIVLGFDKFTDLNKARFEVATLIRQVYPKLPQRVSYPEISLNKPDDRNTERELVSYSINAPDEPLAIQKKVKNYIEPELGMLKGVYKVEVTGAMPEEYVFRYNDFLLKQLNISKQDIISALNKWFSRTGLGNVNYGGKFIAVSLKSPEPVNWQIPIRKIGERVIYLNDLASVHKSAQEPRQYYRVNGKNAITLSLYAENNTNTIALAKKVEKKMAELKSRLPAHYAVIKTYDATDYLKKELLKIYKRTAYTIIILLLFIVFVTRNLRYLFITVVSLAANLGIAFLIYYAFGIELQLFSLAGITISLGLIIDNAIVMIDHIKKQGNIHAFIPILASTLTTIAALSIIYFLDDTIKLNLIDFAWVIIINLSVSLVIALFFIPALLEKIPLQIKKSGHAGIKIKQAFYRFYEHLLQKILSFKWIFIFLAVWAFGIPFFMLPQKIESDSRMAKIYNNTYGNTWFSDNVRPFIDKYLGGSLRLFSYYVFENAYYGKNEETRLYVNASMEKGATIHQMNEAFLQIENYLQQFDQIKKFVSHIYSGDFASLEITFKDEADPSFPYKLKALLIRKSLDLGGIDWGIYGVGRGFSNNSAYSEPINFRVKATGYNYDALNAWADTLKSALLKHPRIRQVSIKSEVRYARKPSYEYTFAVDREKLAVRNKNTSQLIADLKTIALVKQPDAHFTVQGANYPVRLESDAVTDYDLWYIKHDPLDSLNSYITLNTIATITKTKEEERIKKNNQEYIRWVMFQYTGSQKFGSKYLNEKLDELKTKLPLGYTFQNDDYSWFLRKDKQQHYILFLGLILVLIYMICAVLFESLTQPLIILSIVPISYIGVFLTFYLFDFNFDQGGLASFILLSGITVNASIYILNAYNRLKIKNPEKDALLQYVNAFKLKIFPILLTVISTVLGFIPFVIEGQNEVFWFALGVGTIGGLLFSIIGILFYLPLFTLKKQVKRQK